MRITREFRFEAAHHLVDYDGKCARPHGHSYVLRVTLRGPIRDDGLVHDFVDLRKTVEERVLDRLDHTDLNDLLPQPSAEHLAVWCWDALADLPLDEIVIAETPTCWVSYRGPEQEP